MKKYYIHGILFALFWSCMLFIGITNLCLRLKSATTQGEMEVAILKFIPYPFLLLALVAIVVGILLRK